MRPKEKGKDEIEGRKKKEEKYFSCILRKHVAILQHFVCFHFFSLSHFVKPVLGEVLERMSQNDRGIENQMKETISLEKY